MCLAEKGVWPGADGLQDCQRPPHPNPLSPLPCPGLRPACIGAPWDGMCEAWGLLSLKLGWGRDPEGICGSPGGLWQPRHTCRGHSWGRPPAWSRPNLSHTPGSITRHQNDLLWGTVLSLLSRMETTRQGWVVTNKETLLSEHNLLLPVTFQQTFNQNANNGGRPGKCGYCNTN